MRATQRSAAPIARRALWAPWILILMLAGCAAVRPPSFQPHGDTARRVLAMQRLDPDAGSSSASAAGMDGRSAAAAQQRYQKSFSDAQHGSAPIVSGK